MQGVIEERPFLKRELKWGAFLEMDLQGGSFWERRIDQRYSYRTMEKGSF